MRFAPLQIPKPGWNKEEREVLGAGALQGMSEQPLLTHAREMINPG